MRFFRKKERKPEIKEELNAEVKRLKDLERDLEGYSYPLSVPLYLRSLPLIQDLPQDASEFDRAPIAFNNAHLDFHVDGTTHLVFQREVATIKISNKIDIAYFDPEKFIEELKKVMEWRGKVYHMKRELEKSELYPLLKSLKTDGDENKK